MAVTFVTTLQYSLNLFLIGKKLSCIGRRKKTLLFFPTKESSTICFEPKSPNLRNLFHRSWHELVQNNG